MQVLVLIAVLLSSGVRLRDDNRDGVELKTDLEQADRDRVHQIVQQTVRQADTLLTRIGVEGRRPEALRLRVFARVTDFEAYQRRSRDQESVVQSLSFYNPDDREVACAWDGGSTAGRGQLAGHCARLVLLQFDEAPPNWFEEGFAGYFEGFRTDAYGDPISRVHEERLVHIRDALTRGTWCPLAELMVMKDIDFYGWAGSRNRKWSRATLAAESWSLVFYLFEALSPPEREFLDPVVQRLNTGRWRESQVTPALAGIEQRWIEFIQGDSFRAGSELLAEAWTDLGRGSPIDARAKASRVLSYDEGNRSARRVLAKAALLAGDARLAASSYAQLLEGREDLDALLGKSAALLRAGQEEQDRAALEGAIDAGRRAVELAPPEERHVAWLAAADAAEALGAPDRALEFVRAARKEKAVPADVLPALREREQALVRAAAGQRP